MPPPLLRHPTVGSCRPEARTQMGPDLTFPAQSGRAQPRCLPIHPNSLALALEYKSTHASDANVVSGDARRQTQHGCCTECGDGTTFRYKIQGTRRDVRIRTTHAEPEARRRKRTKSASQTITQRRYRYRRRSRCGRCCGGGCPGPSSN